MSNMTTLPSMTTAVKRANTIPYLISGALAIQKRKQVIIVPPIAKKSPVLNMLRMLMSKIFSVIFLSPTVLSFESIKI